MYCLSDLCCVCLKTDVNLCHLSKMGNDQPTYYLKLISCVPEMNSAVIHDQRLVCHRCCESIDSVFNFREKCIRNKDIFTKYLSKLNPSCTNTSEARVCLVDVRLSIKKENDFPNVTVKKEITNADQPIKIKHELVIKTEADSNIKPEIKDEPEIETAETIKSQDNLTFARNFDSSQTPSTDYIDLSESSNNSVLKTEEYSSHGDFTMDFDDYIVKNGEIPEPLRKYTQDFIEEIYMCTSDSENDDDGDDINIISDDESLTIDESKFVTDKNVDNSKVVDLTFEENTNTVPIENVSDANCVTSITNTEILKENVNVDKKIGNSADPKNDKGSTYDCHLCNKKYKWKKSLTIHMSTHSGETFKCNICKKIYSSPYALKKHMKRHTDKNDAGTKCTKCQLVFADLDKLEQHMLIHSGEKFYQCSVCKKKFKDFSEVHVHMQGHTKSRYKCPLCNAVFKEISLLNKHMQTHDTNAHKCEACGKEFLETKNLILHMQTHTEKEHECSVCKEKMKCLSVFMSHIQTHIKEKMHECIICNLKFNQPDALFYHMKIHAGQKLSCNNCNSDFETPSELLKHIQSHMKQTYDCTMCKKKFSQPWILIMHMRSHTAAMVCTCGACGFSKMLEPTHKQVHSSLRFECDVCKKKFNNADIFAKHMQLHTDEQMFCCKFCKKKCNDSKSLKEHLRTHTGEKPYSCSLCKKKFRTADIFKKHMRVHGL